MIKPLNYYLRHSAALLILMCLSSCTSYLGSVYQRGHQAFLRQDYHQAFVNLHQAALYHNMQAQYALGYLYYYGLGVKKNDIAARRWFYRSASFGNTKAMAAIKSLDASSKYPNNESISNQPPINPLNTQQYLPHPRATQLPEPQRSK